MALEPSVLGSELERVPSLALLHFVSRSAAQTKRCGIACSSQLPFPLKRIQQMTASHHTMATDRHLHLITLFFHMND